MNGHGDAGRLDPENIAGIGMVFKRNPSNENVVYSIIAGSPAESSGIAQVGDVVTKVNSVDVRNLSLPKLRNLVLGPEGSRVNLMFERQTGQGIREINVVLVRQKAGSKQPMPQFQTLEQVDEEMRKVKLQAAEETRLRAQEEGLRMDMQEQLHQEQQTLERVERHIETVLRELRSETQVAQQLIYEHQIEKEKCDKMRGELEEQLWVADNTRVSAELQVKREQRDRCCGGLFAT